MCPLHHFEAVQFLCLTPKTPKAKDPCWRGLRHKGADQSSLCTGKWLGKKPRDRAIFVFVLLEARLQLWGSGEEAWEVLSWVSPSGPAWGKRDVKRARAYGDAPASMISGCSLKAGEGKLERKLCPR